MNFQLNSTKPFGMTAPSLIASLNYAYKAGTLSVSQRQGVIKLIPKKDVNPHLIKNWHPLTLLNCDYKIATKAITNRIKSVIPQLINNDQTDFLKGRFIGENIRLINNVINYTAQHEIPGVLLFINFEKAFDSLGWSFVNHMFQYFGFAPPPLKIGFKLFIPNLKVAVWTLDGRAIFLLYKEEFSKAALCCPTCLSCLLKC